ATMVRWPIQECEDERSGFFHLGHCEQAKQRRNECLRVIERMKANHFLLIRFVGYELTPISSTRSRDRGTAMGDSHFRLGSSSRARSAWAEPISRARRPALRTSAAAAGKACSNFSTARMVTSSASPLNCCARPANTLMFVNVVVRMISFKNVAFLLF